MATKTKDKILTASRLLFNDEGVSNVAMVDIAATIDISPGNLYYHYRGKDELIPVLFELFAAELSALVAADVSALKSLEDRWTFNYLIFDTLYNYRCLHGLDTIRFDKSLVRRYKRLQQSLANCIEVLIHQEQLEGIESGDVSGHDIPSTDKAEHHILAENIAVFMFAWVTNAELNIDKASEQKYLNDGVYRVFYQLSSETYYRSKFLERCKSIQQQALSGS